MEEHKDLVEILKEKNLVQTDSHEKLLIYVVKPVPNKPNERYYPLIKLNPKLVTVEEDRFFHDGYRMLPEDEVTKRINDPDYLLR